MNICDDFQNSVTQMSSTFYSVSRRLENRNLHSFFHSLILLPGDTSLNPGATCHLSISSLLPKIEVLRIIEKSANTVIIGVSEFKLGKSVLEHEIHIYNYKIIHCDRNRFEGGVACYIRNDFICIIISVFFFEMSLINSIPIIFGITNLHLINPIFWKY